VTDAELRLASSVDTERPVLLHVVTVPMSLTFLRGQVGYMQARGLDVRVLTSPGLELQAFAATEGVAVAAVRMPRRLTPVRDLLAVVTIVHVIRRARPAIVHAATPKGGLLGTIAAAVAGVPVRIYHVRGLPMETATGAARHLLRATEWVACHLAHRVLCVSESVRDVVIAERLCPADRIRVLGGGSGNGVDADGRFDPAHLPAGARADTRARYDIPSEAPVIGFIGRLVRDKGVIELAAAWRRLRDEYPAAHLLLVGPFERRDPVPADAGHALRSDPRVHLVGECWDTPALYAAMDVVALPTYREGFPNVPLEAAAMRLPVVATRVSGCTDAVVDGETGTLVPARDADALADALGAYLSDGALRQRHGEAGRERVVARFRQETVWAALHEEYAWLLATHSPIARARSASTIALRAELALKRTMDAILAIVALVVLAPIIALTAIAVRARLGAPVLFRQVRPGRHALPFTLYKFRTMAGATTDATGEVIPDAARLTSLGRRLRALSVDELPQLWNVLRGEMSLIGPRPLLMEYLPLYTREQARRHAMRPGITGLAQVSGRNAIGWDARLALDVWYVDHWSPWLDARILWRTIGKVASRAGVTQPGHVTMERFHGTAD